MYAGRQAQCLAGNSKACPHPRLLAWVRHSPPPITGKQMGVPQNERCPARGRKPIKRIGLGAILVSGYVRLPPTDRAGEHRTPRCWAGPRTDLIPHTLLPDMVSKLLTVRNKTTIAKRQQNYRTEQQRQKQQQKQPVEPDIKSPPRPRAASSHPTTPRASSSASASTEPTTPMPIEQHFQDRTLFPI